MTCSASIIGSLVIGTGPERASARCSSASPARSQGSRHAQPRSGDRGCPHCRPSAPGRPSNSCPRGVESMKSDPCAGNASADSVEPNRSAQRDPAGRSAFTPFSAPVGPAMPASGRPGRRRALVGVAHGTGVPIMPVPGKLTQYCRKRPAGLHVYDISGWYS